uniref:Uncharacterized protein n=1 Tax=Leersia perrieri TaxID=77586 RepID=A0A0D9XBB9_9ORYZ
MALTHAGIERLQWRALVRRAGGRRRWTLGGVLSAGRVGGEDEAPSYCRFIRDPAGIIRTYRCTPITNIDIPALVTASLLGVVPNRARFVSKSGHRRAICTLPVPDLQLKSGVPPTPEEDMWGWILMLGFPLDRINHANVNHAVSGFGHLDYWPQNDPIKGRVLVRVFYKDLDSVPQHIVWHEPHAPNGQSWTIYVYMLDGEFADVMPPDEDLFPPEDVDHQDEGNIWQFSQPNQQGGAQGGDQGNHGWPLWDNAAQDDNIQAQEDPEEPPVPDLVPEQHLDASSLTSFSENSSAGSAMGNSPSPALSVGSNVNQPMVSADVFLANKCSENSLILKDQNVDSEMVDAQVKDYLCQNFPQIMFNDNFIKGPEFWSRFANMHLMSSPVLQLGSSSEQAGAASAIEVYHEPIPIEVVPPSMDQTEPVTPTNQIVPCNFSPSLSAKSKAKSKKLSQPETEETQEIS